MTEPGRHRSSDRWVTPGVVMFALFMAGVVILGVLGIVAWLTAQGIDPGPVVALVGNIATAVGALGTLLLQLAGRATVAKVERNTGLLAGTTGKLAETVATTADKVDAALWVDDQATTALPPVPPPVRTQPHPFRAPAGYGAAPAGGGE